MPPLSPPRSSRGLAIAGSMAALAVVAWVDYITGSEVSVWALYVVPIAWIVWQANVVWGFVMSLLAAGAWIWADFADKHYYVHPWIRWERGAMNLLVFCFIAFSFDGFKRSLASKSRKVKQLQGILPICIACNRIRDSSGRWTDLDTYLREHSEAQPEARLCPECTGARYR